MKTTTKTAEATAMEKLRASPDRTLPGMCFTLAEQAALWDLKKKGVVDVHEASRERSVRWVIVSANNACSSSGVRTKEYAK